MKIVEVFLYLLGAIALVVVVAMLTSILIWSGWNFGVVDASGGRLPKISLGTAFWLSLFGAAVGSFFKSDLKVKER